MADNLKRDDIEVTGAEELSVVTERLVLRPWRLSDAKALYKYASDERVGRIALWPRHTSVEMSRSVITDFFIPNPMTLAMVLRQTGEAIGCIGLVPKGDEHFTLLEGEREVGYWVGYPYWGQGLTTEALKALISYCRDTLHLPSLLITLDARNIGSRRVAEKCGFTWIEDYVLCASPGKAYRLTL